MCGYHREGTVWVNQFFYPDGLSHIGCNKKILKGMGTKMKTTVLCYERCSTCKKALNWLKEKGVEYELRPIKEQNPTKEELTEWYRKSGLPLKRFFNTSGNLYKEMNLKDKLVSMSEEEQLTLLSTDGMLVKRPLVVAKDHVLTGFKEEEWKVLLNEN